KTFFSWLPPGWGHIEPDQVAHQVPSGTDHLFIGRPVWEAGGPGSGLFGPSESATSDYQTWSITGAGQASLGEYVPNGTFAYASGPAPADPLSKWSETGSPPRHSLDSVALNSTY